MSGQTQAARKFPHIDGGPSHPESHGPGHQHHFGIIGQADAVQIFGVGFIFLRTVRLEKGQQPLFHPLLEGLGIPQDPLAEDTLRYNILQLRQGQEHLDQFPVAFRVLQVQACGPPFS
ncbi:hypothetical protein MOOR_27790 [Moorella thermoacetica]|uniref:Uncharacterized protein n=1 Tax=Neomoorella thermoacetica TaxID=1525 RepID=A0A1J5JSR7_NEOTH|nr:hypothetical protein MOOR_27790 [Moorella thermoacetica]